MNDMVIEIWNAHPHLGTLLSHILCIALGYWVKK